VDVNGRHSLVARELQTDDETTDDRP